MSAPASIVAEELMVIITELDTAGHGPIGSSEVIVNVTELAAISPAPGVYIALGLFTLLNVPSPEVDQFIVDDAPEKEPNRFTSPFAQIVVSNPAETTGDTFITILTESVTEEQGVPGLSVVKNNVASPFIISFAPGV